MSIISHLQLDRFRLLELVIESDPKFDYDLPEGEYRPNKVKFDFLTRKDDPAISRFHLEVETRPKGDNCAYRRVRIKVDGIFKLDGEASDEVKKILPMAPLSILYGMARGIVANASSLGPRPLLLPSVNFLKWLKRKVKPVWLNKKEGPRERQIRKGHQGKQLEGRRVLVQTILSE